MFCRALMVATFFVSGGFRHFPLFCVARYPATRLRGFAFVLSFTATLVSTLALFPLSLAFPIVRGGQFARGLATPA